MPNHPNRSALNTPINTPLEHEAARLTYATARVRTLTEIELRLLELAVQAPDDNTARQLELKADTVWRDALALTSEHNPTQSGAWPKVGIDWLT